MLKISWKRSQLRERIFERIFFSKCSQSEWWTSTRSVRSLRGKFGLKLEFFSQGKSFRNPSDLSVLIRALTHLRIGKHWVGRNRETVQELFSSQNRRGVTKVAKWVFHLSHIPLRIIPQSWDETSFSKWLLMKRKFFESLFLKGPFSIEIFYGMKSPFKKMFESF